MRENFSALQAKWQNEKDAIGVVQKLREREVKMSMPKSKRQKKI